MSLSTVLKAMVEYVGDVVVNDCNRPVPDRLLRYQGRPPDDCCSEAGTLSAYWVEGRPSSGADRSSPCGGPPEFTLHLRYTTCWFLPDVDASGVTLNDPRWDADAAMLADVADCVARALIRLLCVEISDPLEDPLAVAVVNELVGRNARLQDVTPILPLGGCAGVQWRVIVAVRNPAVSS